MDVVEVLDEDLFFKITEIANGAEVPAPGEDYARCLPTPAVVERLVVI